MDRVGHEGLTVEEVLLVPTEREVVEASRPVAPDDGTGAQQGGHCRSTPAIDDGSLHEPGRCQDEHDPDGEQSGVEARSELGRECHGTQTDQALSDGERGTTHGWGRAVVVETRHYLDRDRRHGHRREAAEEQSEQATSARLSVDCRAEGLVARDEHPEDAERDDRSADVRPLHEVESRAADQKAESNRPRLALPPLDAPREHKQAEAREHHESSGSLGDHERNNKVDEVETAVQRWPERSDHVDEPRKGHHGRPSRAPGPVAARRRRGSHEIAHRPPILTGELVVPVTGSADTRIVAAVRLEGAACVYLPPYAGPVVIDLEPGR